MEEVRLIIKVTSKPLNSGFTFLFYKLRKSYKWTALYIIFMYTKHNNDKMMKLFIT